MRPKPLVASFGSCSREPAPGASTEYAYPFMPRSNDRRTDPLIALFAVGFWPTQENISTAGPPWYWANNAGAAGVLVAPAEVIAAEEAVFFGSLPGACLWSGWNTRDMLSQFNRLLSEHSFSSRRF